MQFRRIVIGVDFTEASLAAARWAALQLAPRAEVVLVHALPDPHAPAYLQPYLPDAVELSALLAPVFHGGLRGLAGLIGAERTRVFLAAGEPADVLARAAHECGADLVCVGRGARRRGSARFGATTAQRLLARTRVATVVVPAGRHDTPARVLAALDDRAGGERVLRVAGRLAAAFEARVDVLHALGDDLRDLVQAARDVVREQAVARAREAADGAVAEHPCIHERRHARGPGASADVEALPAAPVPAHPPVDGTRGPAHAAADAEMDGPWLRALAQAWVMETLDRAGLSPVRTTPVVRFGDAGQELVAHLARGDVDLVVIGRGGDASLACAPLGALPVGSTTRLVTWAAPCPVLVLSLDGGSVTRTMRLDHARRLRLDRGGPRPERPEAS